MDLPRKNNFMEWMKKQICKGRGVKKRPGLCHRLSQDNPVVIA